MQSIQTPTTKRNRQSKTPRLVVIPTDNKDEKKAKIMQSIVDTQYEEYGELVDAIVRLKVYLQQAYGITPPNELFEDILKEVIKKDLNNK